MQKNNFLTKISLTAIFLAGLTSCSEQAKPKDFAVSFKDGVVTFTYGFKNTDEYNIYRLKKVDGEYEKVTETKSDTYVTGDIYSYYVFESKETKERTTPYSYIRSAFGSDAVKIFSENDDKEAIQDDIDRVYNTMEWDEFSPDRYAYLFMPGDYSSIEEKVGYYTTVSGLGYSPDEIKLKTVTRYNSPLTSGALCNFWCGVENVSTTNDVDFYVSQATYLRRMHIQGSITLSDSGYSSGGFLANSKIDKEIKNTTQQQYFFRNDVWGNYTGNVDINMVYSGVEGKMNYSWPNKRVTVLPTTKLIKEKPFLVFDENEGLGLFEPSLQEETKGVSWADGEDGDFHPLDEFYIAHSEKDDSKSLNAILSAGQSIIFTPGTYVLDEPLQVEKENTILYGMGMATLRSGQNNKDAIIKTKDVDGLVVSDLLLEAGSVMKNMIVVGDKAGTSHEDNPTILADLFLRLGGNLNITTGCDEALVINSNNVLGDNFWLWRADHGMDRTVLEPYIQDDGTLPSNIGSLTNYGFWKGLGVGWKDQTINNYATTGALINGDDVTLYGLMCEHFGEYQTIWKGERGYMVFYQSETPYDAPNQDAWRNGDGEEGEGFASYKVDDDVIDHTAIGLGVYYVQNNASKTNIIVLDHAIEAPSNEGIDLEHCAIANFKGDTGSGIRHIVNSYGDGNIRPYKEQKTSLTSFKAGVAKI